MIAVRPGEVVRVVPDVVCPKKREAALDAQSCAVHDASESGVRNQTERIRLRIELGQTQPELVAAVVIERLLRERIDGLLGAVDAERQFVDLRRAECVNQRRDQSRTVDLVADRQLRPAIRTAKAGE